MPEKLLLDNKQIVKQAELFAALSDPTRLKLLRILCHQNPPGYRCVNSLSCLLGVTQPAVSQHLKILKSVGLVTGERRGFRMHYTVDSEGLKRCQRILSIALEFSDNKKKDSCDKSCHQTKNTRKNAVSLPSLLNPK